MNLDDLAVSLADLRQRRGVKWTQYGPDVLPAWVADMDFPIADPVQRAIDQFARRQDYGYHTARGPAAVRTAFTEHMQTRFGWEVGPDRVQVINDVMQGIHAVIHVCTQPGDGIIVPLPIYPPFLGAVQDNQRTLVAAPLVRGATRYEWDMDALRAAVNGRTRILLLCNPHNPTGRAFSRDELHALAEIVLENDLLVISDEVHADLLYAGATHIPFATLSHDIAERTVTVTSATKAFNIAGLRCAVMHFGSEALHTQFDTLPRNILGETNCIGEDATVAAWREGGLWLETVLAQLDANRRTVADFLARRLPQIDYLMPEATYLAWLDCTRLEVPELPSRFFLKRAKVAFSNGALFGEGYDRCVRLNFATSPAILDHMLAQCADAVDAARNADA